MKHMRLLLGASLALCSVWAVAQDAPELLLPPGFDKPAPRPSPARSQAPETASRPAPVEGEDPGGASAPVAQRLPRSSSGSGSAAASGSFAGAPATAPAGRTINLPPVDVLEKMSAEDLENLLGIKPKYDMPAAARRSMKQIGVLGAGEGGMPAGALAAQNASLVRAAIAGNRGTLVSRWGHILLRRALVSRMDAPDRMNPADLAALRAQLLVRMGEGEAARSLVQDIDAGNYTPDLTQAAFDAYIFTADFTGICPAVTVHGDARKDAQWQAARAICSAFRGEGAAGLTQLDRQLNAGAMPKIDLQLAQKYAGAAGKARRAVKIEWDDIGDMTPWRYALTIGVGLEPPAALMQNAGPRYDYMAVAAPMLGLTSRAAAADRAAGHGILSSAAMVDLYSQIYADQEITGDWATRATQLRDAYVGSDAQARLAAMRQLWDGAKGEQQRYSRQVLTAYAAARMPVESGLAASAPDLIASMLSAGLDRNAIRWAVLADVGSLEWAMLALAAPNRAAPVEEGALKDFQGRDQSENARKSAFLLAGLAGLDRVTPQTMASFAERLEVDMVRRTRWTSLIDQSAAAGNSGLVALLAGVGMQGDSWAKMTPLHLYHIVSALRRTGLEAEARMIAAEAVARG